MASQKQWNVSLEEQLRNREFYFHWNKNLPVNGEAKNPTDFQLESSLLHKENLQLPSKPKHSRTLKRGFQSISTRGMSPQHQGVVTKPLSVRIVPMIGTSTSLSVKDDLKFYPSLNVKSFMSFSEEIQKCTSPLKRESDSKGKAVVQGTEGLVLGNHKLDCDEPADAQVSKFKSYQEGISVASSLALLEPMQSLSSSEGPTDLLKHGCCAGRTTQRPPESGSPTCTTSPASSNISHKDMHAPPLAPQKVKDFQKLTHVSKRGLDHQFEKQQIMISYEHVAAYSSGDKIIADMNALQPTQSIDRSTACFQGQNPCSESNVAAVRVENTELQIYLDCQSSKVRNAVLKKVSAVDGVVPEHSVGSQKVAVLEIEGKTEPHDSSSEMNHSSSNSGPSSSGDKKRFRESIASITMQGTERHFPRSRLLMSPAYAPIPVPAPVFSSGEPSLPLLMTCLQSSSELVQTSTHSHEDSLELPHIPPLDLQKFSCSQSLENRSKENINSGKPLSAYQKRFIDLQAFLRLCDEADQMDLLQALRSLSAPARSGHAFNLETRALRLSVEEGKEMIRLKMLNVMGRSLSPKGQKAELGSTPAGIRLPAPNMPSCTTLDA